MRSERSCGVIKQAEVVGAKDGDALTVGEPVGSALGDRDTVGAVVTTAIPPVGALDALRVGA